MRVQNTIRPESSKGWWGGYILAFREAAGGGNLSVLVLDRGARRMRSPWRGTAGWCRSGCPANAATPGTPSPRSRGPPHSCHVPGTTWTRDGNKGRESKAGKNREQWRYTSLERLFDSGDVIQSISGRWLRYDAVGRGTRIAPIFHRLLLVVFFQKFKSPLFIPSEKN
jgi:hypothetical protein